MMGEDAIIVAIVFGSVITIVFMSILGSILKAWVKRGSGKNITDNQEFLAALREFKEKTERRLSNIEAIITDEHPKAKQQIKKEESGKGKEKNALEIELGDETEKEDSGQSTKLRNMLNQ